MSPRSASTADAYLTALLAANRNLLVPHYLIHSWLYYEADLSVASDAHFDRLCRDLLAEFPSLIHRHKHLVDPECLTAGTGFYLKDRYPSIVPGAALALYRRFHPPHGRQRKRGK